MMMNTLISFCLMMTSFAWGQSHETIMEQCQVKRRAAGVDTNLYGSLASNSLELEISREDLPSDQEAQRIETIMTNPKFYNFRGHVQHADWDRSENDYWNVQNESACLSKLDQMGIKYKKTKTYSPVPSAVEVENGFVLDGIRFAKGNLKTLLFSCEFLIRLPHLTKILKQNSVTAVEVMSYHRLGTLPGDPSKIKCGPKTTESFHHTGLAMDIAAVTIANGQRLDLSYVKDIGFMFSGTVGFNQDITSWNTNSVTNMREMFKETPVFNQDLSGWNVGNVVTSMLEQQHGLLLIDRFVISKLF